MFTKGLEIHVRQRTMKKEIEALGDAEAILAYKVGMADRWKKEGRSSPLLQSYG